MPDGRPDPQGQASLPPPALTPRRGRSHLVPCPHERAPPRRRPPGSAPPISLALSRVGVTGVHKALRIRRGAQEILMAAELECTVDLARDQKGVHMSRFPELFDKAIDDVVLGEGCSWRTSPTGSRRTSSSARRALRAEVRIVARWPLRRRTPVTGLTTQEMVSLIGIAAATAPSSRRVVGVEATGINACPCARGSSADGRPSASRRRASATTSSGSWSSSRSRRTTSAAAGPCSSGRRRARRRGSRGDRRALDERPGLRAPQAAGRALRRRARPPPAALRRGLGARRTRRAPRAEPALADDDFVLRGR